MKYVSYLRVSTNKQGLNGLGIEAQRKAVKDLADAQGAEIIKEFSEVESGGKITRAELDAALELCRKEKAALLVATVDRLARSVYLVAAVMESSIQLVCADMPMADEFNIHIIAAVGQKLRRDISIATKAALDALKAKGKKLGNKNIRAVAAAGRAARTVKANKNAENVYPVIERIKSFGITTLRGIAKELTDRKIETPSGRPVWHPQQVKLIIDRVENERR